MREPSSSVVKELLDRDGNVLGEYKDTGKHDSVKKGPVRRESAKIGRNDPCPCGSGKKYKMCCGRNL